MLSCKHAYQLISVIAHEFFVCPLAEVHNKVGGVEAERLCDAEQVGILTDKNQLVRVSACLDNTR